MTDVMLSTALFECPGISKAHLVAFRRWLWPRHETLAQLEQYQGVFGRSSGLKGMEPGACLGLCHCVAGGAACFATVPENAACKRAGFASRAFTTLPPAAASCRHPCARRTAELRQLVEAVFAQESEWVLVAVLQHLIDGYCTRLISAPRCIGECC